MTDTNADASGTDGDDRDGRGTDEDAYSRELTANREEKDRFLAEHDQSPVPPGEREGFDGLDYYPPDPEYRVEATLEVHDDPDPVVMETTADTEVRYERVATLHFELDGEERTLAAYQQSGSDESLFVPFRDKTTGQQTYGAGRYMELEATGDLEDGDEIPVDFNLAYNPFCAYSDAYTCPLPPQENWLETTIEAGEKDWE